MRSPDARSCFIDDHGVQLDLSVISSISAPADVADIGSPDDDSASFSQMGPRGTLADISALMNATRDEGGGSGAVDDLGADALICKRLSEQFLDGDKAGRGRRARDAPGKLDLGTLPSVYRTGVANTQITSVFDLLNASPESLVRTRVAVRSLSPLIRVWPLDSPGHGGGTGTVRRRPRPSPGRSSATLVRHVMRCGWRPEVVRFVNRHTYSIRLPGSRCVPQALMVCFTGDLVVGLAPQPLSFDLVRPA